MPNNDNFHFDISLSVLNHLGRNLYRNFITVLGEAISNSWDADARNVWIYISDDASDFVVKDDGNGMTRGDFQDKFLRIGYSKRTDLNSNRSSGGRPFIGRKGIGKLALLSCANRIAVITKTLDTNYVGGAIDDGELGNAINNDLTASEYPLEEVNLSDFSPYTTNHDKGTIIKFSGLKQGMSSSEDNLRKALALYFRFSLIDETFKIHLNDEIISIDNLEGLVNDTQFLWELNQLNDPLIARINEKVVRKKEFLDIPNIKGFIASVVKPTQLKIYGAGEKVGVDLFVNGRLREKDILRHVPSARVPESYMYGQIHYDGLDEGEKDRFTSSREGIVADDELFQELIEIVKTRMPRIIDDWDKWRIEMRLEGDPENLRATKKARASKTLFNETIDSYKDVEGAQNDTVDDWAKNLSEDAEYNFSAYADCFVAENITRKLIKHKSLQLLDPEDIKRKESNKRIESDLKRLGNLSIGIRREDDDLYYLDMEPLIRIVQPKKTGEPNDIYLDERRFTPIRNAVMHTSILTQDAKEALSAVRANIAGKIKQLISRS